MEVEVFTGLLTGKVLVTCSCDSGVYKDSLNCILIRSLCVFYEIIRGPYVILSTTTVTCFLGFFILYCSQQTFDVNAGSRYLVCNRSV